MALQRSHTATLARNEVWQNEVLTEPYEAGWAHEAVFFVRALDASGALDGATAHVQLSPDGIHWVDEGTRFALPATAGALSFGRVARFGSYLRLRAVLPQGTALRVIVGMSARETAAVVNLSEGAVRILCHRGLRTLARQLDSERLADGIAP